MKSIRDLLGEHLLFRDFHPDLLELMAGCGHNVHFAAGEQILTEGAPANEFYLIRSGKASVGVTVPNRGTVLIETLGPDEVIGVSWPFPPYRWEFSSTAIDPTSAIAMDAECLRNKCDQEPLLGYQVFKSFARLMRDRLQATRLQLLDLYGNHAG
ncbi:MAG: cyclic nucleotide-binding domain-containing protein [Acidimicrobiia bacterium]|nr:cyclic nucleotide-binding domain-containing protein [Acidimicrobiia bacterium]